MLGHRRTRHSACAMVLCGLVTTVLAFPTEAGGKPGVGIAQPMSYVSPSGVFALFVDPFDRQGYGGARYRLTQNGNEIWSGQKPYALREVTVTDDGLAAGMAYRQLPRDENERRAPDRFMHITILGVDGGEILNEVTQQQYPRRSHGRPQPDIAQFLVDPANDRLIARVNARGAPWWTYRLSTGTALSRVNAKELAPDLENLKYVIHAQFLPDTPLTLVHWYTKGPDFKVKDAGGTFVLLDEELRPIWWMEAENDYAEVDFGRSRFRGGPSAYFERHPALELTAPGGRFDLRLFAENKYVSLVARQTSGGEWNVAELGRVDVLPHETENSAPPTRKNSSDAWATNP